jgi:hypothetical protein
VNLFHITSEFEKQALKKLGIASEFHKNIPSSKGPHDSKKFEKQYCSRRKIRL